MFLHLGGDVLISQKEVVVILNLETSSEGSGTKNFLKNVIESNKVTYISESGKEKSLVITTDNYYFSPISSVTLLRRSSTIENEEN